MKGSKILKGLSVVVSIFVFVFAIVNLDAQEKKHVPKMLTKEQKMMMKNGAMKNMDKYMANMDAMMKKLPMALKKTQGETLEFGKKLFNDPKALSANGQACASCHPGGGTTGGEVETPMASELTGKPYKLPVPTLVGAAATFPKFKVPNDAVIDLTDMQNNCIMMFMMAQPLDKTSKEARALTAYVASLSNDDKVSVGAMPEMMKKMMGKMGKKN
ncbi:MAG: c-type cytochrome [bacterium]